MRARLSRGGNARCARGFVLLYVLWILAAIALTLGAFSLRSRGGAAVSERALSQSLETRQMVTVLDYVLRYAAEFDVQLDSRLAQYEQAMTQKAAQAATVDDRLAVLRELLAAMNFKLDAIDPRLLEQEKAEKEAKAAKEALAAKKDPAAAASAASTRPTATNMTRIRVKYSPNPTPYTLRVGDAQFEVTVEPGNARPNLNTLEAAAFQRYLAHLGLPKERAAQLVAVVQDWIDNDDFTRDGGAESSYYRGLPAAYRPRNDVILSSSELGYLKGMTPDVLLLLRENFSFYGNDTGVKPGALSAAAIGALADLPPERAQLGLKMIEAPAEIKPGTPLLEQAEEQKLFRTVSLREERRYVRVRVQGQYSRVTAWYDTQARRMLDWWFD